MDTAYVREVSPPPKIAFFGVFVPPFEVPETLGEHLKIHLLGGSSQDL